MVKYRRSSTSHVSASGVKKKGGVQDIVFSAIEWTQLLRLVTQKDILRCVQRWLQVLELMNLSQKCVKTQSQTARNNLRLDT